MRRFGESRDQFCYHNCGSSPVWRGTVTDIPQYSWAKCNGHLNSDVEKGIFIYLPIVCFVLKLTNSCSVGGQWRRLGWVTCPFLMALIPGARCLVSPKHPFFPSRVREPPGAPLPTTTVRPSVESTLHMKRPRFLLFFLKLMVIFHSHRKHQSESRK